MSLNDRIVVADLDHSEQNTLDELVLQWRAKRKRNALRAGFYDMKNSTRALLDSNAPNAVKRKAFVLGWASLAVDKLNRRCNIEGFYDPNHDLDALGMADVWRTNRLGMEISQAGQASLKFAVAWLITTQGDTEAGEPEVLINGRDALSGTGLWDARRRAIRAFLSLTDLDDKGEPVGMTMYLWDVNVIMTKAGGKWRVERRTHSYGLPVDPLRYMPELGRPFGRSRINRTVMSLQTQALGAMIRADVNGEAYSLPRYVLLGATESAFQNADGSIKPTWQAAWDAIWAIGDDPEAASDALARADVKQFHGQSPEPQNAHLRMLGQTFSGETGIPIGELGIIGDSNPTSAEALQVSRDDLITEAGQTTEHWTPDLSSAVTRALTMLNEGDVPDDLNPLAHWRNPMHVSSSQAADAGSKVIDKVPWLAESEVGLELLGLTPDQIRRAMADRRRAEGTTALATILERAARQVTGGDTDAASA